MKNILIALLCALVLACTTNPKAGVLEDGFYLVQNTGTDNTDFGELSSNEVLVNYNYRFADTVPGDFSRIVVYKEPFVPLELETMSVTENETEARKKLQITLTESAAEKLKSFTANNVMKPAVIVLDGEAVTLHKIRAAITGSQMEITCSDNSCEKLYARMIGKVKK